MKKEGIILGLIGLVTVVIVVGAALLLSQPKEASTQNATVIDKGLLLGPEKDRQAIGSPSAKVTIVEFADYQCPACRLAHPVVEQILEEYKDRVYFVFRNFPLPMHQNAVLAATAAQAAGAQGKYWEMYTSLYENQEEWGESSKAKDLIKSYAEDLGLDTGKFATDLDSQIGKAIIEKDQDDGYKLGVNSTPTFYINGDKLAGVIDYDAFKKELDKRLQ